MCGHGALRQTHRHNFTVFPGTAHFKCDTAFVLRPLKEVFTPPFLAFHRLLRSSVYCAVVLRSPRLRRPSSRQKAHINSSMTGSTRPPWLVIILQLKSCRELEAKWMLWRMLISQNENTAPLWQRGTQPRAWHTFLRVELLMIMYSAGDTLIPLVWVTGPCRRKTSQLEDEVKKDE